MKPNFRIVYLKNDDSRKYNDERIKNTSNILLLSNNKINNDQEQFVPNLFHLSARLQDETQQQKKNINQQSQHLDSLKPNSKTNDTTFCHRKNATKDNQIEIKKFFQTKQIQLQKQKNTMKNLIGSVNFTSNKKVQKKISKLIRQTIKDVCAVQKHHKKKLKQQCRAYSITPNRTQLQTDFQNFLTNKNNQKYKKYTNLEGQKIKKLSITNPEKELLDKTRYSFAKNLNLFHFLQEQHPTTNFSPYQRSRMNSTSNVGTQMNLIKSRVDKKIFNLQPNLKTQQQQFQWSRLRGNKNNHSFAFRTLDL